MTSCFDRIRKIAANGIITTFAGNGNPGFWGDGNLATNSSIHPGEDTQAVAIDRWGSLYIADYGNGRIRIVSNRNGPPIVNRGISGKQGNNGWYVSNVTS